eukprot:g63052.t1
MWNLNDDCSLYIIVQCLRKTFKFTINITLWRPLAVLNQPRWECQIKSRWHFQVIVSDGAYRAAVEAALKFLK